MELMIHCCLMNGYCPYNTPTEIYLMTLVIALLFVLFIDTIRR